MTFSLNLVKQAEQISYFVTKSIAVTTVVDITDFLFSTADLSIAIVAIISIHKSDVIVTFDGVTTPNGLSAIIVGSLLTTGSDYTIEGNANLNNIKLVSSDNVTTADITISLGKIIGSTQ